MRISGLTISDGKMFFASRHADGLHLNAAGLDPRGTNDFGSGTVDLLGDLADIVVVPSPVLMATGGSTYQFTALGFDVFGNLLDITPTWSIVEDTPDAEIDSVTGVLTSGDIGEEEDITVRATVGDIYGEASVSIEDLVIDSIQISPSPWTMTVAQTKLFSAVGLADSVPVNISPVWSKVSGVGSIDPSTGLYTAGTLAGSAVLRATVGDVFANVTVTVNPAALYAIGIFGDTAANNGERVQTFTVVGVDIYSNVVELDGPSVAWTLSPSAGSIGGVPFGETIALTTVPNSGEETLFFNHALSATYGDLTTSATIFVVPEGEPE